MGMNFVGMQITLIWSSLGYTSQYASRGHKIILLLQVSINEIAENDSGEWKCIAENSMGSVSYDKKIQVQTAPEILGYKGGNKTLTKDITEFETLVLNCNVEKNIEKPEIKWFKDGIPIKEFGQKNFELIPNLFSVNTVPTGNCFTAFCFLSLFYFTILSPKK